MAGQSPSYDQLRAETEALREKLAQYSTHQVVVRCLLFGLGRASKLEEPGELSSPARQIEFLLGLLLSTPEPQDPVPFGPEEWSACVAALQMIFQWYASLVLPLEGDPEEVDEEWLRIREVAGQAFLHFFNTGLMASAEQVRDRIERYLVPFDAQISDLLGLTATDAMRVSAVAFGLLTGGDDRMSAAREREEGIRLASLEQGGGSLEDVRRSAVEAGYESAAEDLLAAMNLYGSVSLNDLEQECGDVGLKWWGLFALGRGEVSLDHITDSNPLTNACVVRTGPHVGYCHLPNALFTAVLSRMEGELARSEERDRYLRHRDLALETEVVDRFKTLLGPDASFYQSVYETPDSQFEHDLVVVFNRSAVVVESKATPPSEPFRSADKAYTRLRRAFRSDTGIQKAFEQAERLAARLRNGERVSLYDSSGSLVAEVAGGELDQIETVCVTRDDFGPLAIDLGLLLERESPDIPYPWAVNVYDLGTLEHAWDHLGLNAEDMLRYLSERRAIQGKTLVWDELDVMGFFLQHGGLHWLEEKNPADKYHILPTYSRIFDEIYRWVPGEPRVSVEVTEPFVADMRQMLVEMMHAGSFEEFVSADRKTGRNQPCPCGSGKKFKRCCLRP